MVPEFVARPGGSKRANFGGGLGEREAERSLPQLAPAIRREACGFEDLGRFNLWRPMVVARIGGSRCVQAQPARTELTEVTS